MAEGLLQLKEMWIGAIMCGAEAGMLVVSKVVRDLYTWLVLIGMVNLVFLMASLVIFFRALGSVKHVLWGYARACCVYSSVVCCVVEFVCVVEQIEMGRFQLVPFLVAFFAIVERVVEHFATATPAEAPEE